MNKIQLIEESLKLSAGCLSSTGALVVETGKHTGRATKERFVCDRPETKELVNWGNANQPIDFEFSKKVFSGLQKKLSSLKNYQMKGFVGPFPIEVQSTSPWHIVFCENMFRASPSPLQWSGGPIPRIQVFHDPYGKVSDLGLSFTSETLLILDLHELKVAIIGTAYAGEIKKSAFTICNFKMPEVGHFPMHASANCLDDGKSSCVLFGLSGTGKTTLSASHDRALIGDDEIIWSPTGLSNIEGGCYAKLIDLSEEREPEIYKAVNQFGSIMENVACDPESRIVDFKSKAKTENTRGSYSLSALDRIYRTDREAEPARTIIFLTADAFGALPAVGLLDEYQAQYYFLSGYTAKVAGTEIGVKEPQATFSACFGAPFMPRHPSVYGKLLVEYMNRTKAKVWILNTGWQEGGYGKSERYPIPVSRKILSAIQTGELANQPMTTHPVFGFNVPERCPGVDSKFLRIPGGEAVHIVAKKFLENSAPWKDKVDAAVLEKGAPKILSSQSTSGFSVRQVVA